ncbi:MAG: DUF642 domain-containing protein [Methanoregulaceae archaeon]|nr:DUF642 domain-containing protein [Methanoregulaceae archaeon]
MNRIAVVAFVGLSGLSSAQLINPGLNMLPNETQAVRPVFGGQTYNGWTNPGGPDIEFVSSSLWQTHEGNGAIDLNGVSGPGRLEQTFATTAGTTYIVDFWYSGNNGNGTRLGTKSFNVLWDGGQTQGFVFVHQSTDTYSNMRWTQGTATFVATGSTSTLTFQGTSTQYNDAGAAIDDVTLTAVPEPATLSALGIFVAAVLRRSKSAESPRAPISAALPGG